MTETADYEKSADPTAHASSHESGGADAIDNLGPLTGLVISVDGVITWQGASVATSYLLNLRVSGDTQPRFRARADGQMEWGSGSATPEITLYRFANKTLGTFDSLNIQWATQYFSGQNSAHNIIWALVSGQTIEQFAATIGGTFKWGAGAAATDCLLSRRAANILNTPDRFEVGTLGVANSASGTTPGNCQNKAEIFDAAGNSLGFIAVYDAIT